LVGRGIGFLMMGSANNTVLGKERRQQSFANCSDAMLMTLIAEGEMAALGTLYLRYGGMVACAIVGATPSLPKEEVEDLTQDVFIAVAEISARYKEAGKLKSWLYSVAVRTAKKRRRTLTNRKRLLNENVDQAVAVAGQLSTSGQRVMAKHDLYHAFAGLTETQRQALVLFEYQGMSGEEIAETMNIKLNTVWSHLRRARTAVLSVLDSPAASKSTKGQKR
jgi:RNA polymerase sigma factor (sigma-70 family)